MVDIKIFIGPKKAFEEFVPSGDILLLSDLVKIADGKITRYYESYDFLVGYSENYSGISESAIQNFDVLLKTVDFDKIYLQNPPENIKRLIKNTYDDVTIEIYDYPKLTSQKFLKINDKFNERIIGQNHVKNELLTSMYDLLKGYNGDKPICLLFYGPSGVGKTETAKFLSEIIGDELFRKQFSMFQNNKFSEYLFGGAHMQASFSRDLLERESNIILLDEFDKAANVFHDAFYQLFDEGIFEDSNYKVSLKNSIIICTSNYLDVKDIRKNIGDPLFFRFDKIIEFKKLNKEAIEKILVNKVNKKYDLLTDSDKDLIDKEKIIKYFKEYSDYFVNTRQISKLVEEKKNTTLVESYLNENLTENND
ncbi:MAG: ATP-dependent Clp protease ATP-binding subunit [Methanobrevibacter sp.]|nr:ATP-dependent Clp protease ATP-binding subunit [Methanobrevibacter sp.]